MNSKISNFADVLERKIIIFDGAMGTMIAGRGARAVCNEELNLSHPDVISSIHKEYLVAHADVIIANTFGASSIVLAEHGLDSKMAEINREAVRIAKKAAAEFSSDDKPRFVAGELGPTSKISTLGHISFEKLFDSYALQASVLIEAGADLILIATVQDPLQAKAALAAAYDAKQRTGRDVPVIVSVTVEKIGTMLLGTEIGAALAAVAPYKPLAFGLNCATGPGAMEEHLKFLHDLSPFPIICQPNAGLPENVNGRAVYSLGADEFADSVHDLAVRYKIAIVGGCCGTTPEHISALSKKMRDVKAAKRKIISLPSVSSLYTSFLLDQNPRPFIVAEQTNANGSKKFKELLLKDDYDAMAEIGAAASEASHALDVCVAYTGRDELKDMGELIGRLALKSKAAVMIDSTNPAVIQEALSKIPGRAIINSINLEDGGAKAKKILALAKKYGAAVVCLTIDEKGMAKTAAEKVRVAKRLVAIAEEEGLSVDDLIIDTLTFTVASGDPALKDSAKETLSAIKKLKKEIKGARTILGLSNVSYGLSKKARPVLNSVFFRQAIFAGLDAAIINPVKILPDDSISELEHKTALALIDNKNKDALGDFIKLFEEGGETLEEKSSDVSEKLPADVLRSKIISGSKDGLNSIIEKLFEDNSAEKILNDILMPAMSEVGRRFGEGKTVLPFVLSSAEAMKYSCDILKPHMKRSDSFQKGTIVLATVRGDVHDIGKDLVDVILSNNGYKVVNLGIKQPVQSIMEAAKKENAKAIGLSGLLVSSTEVMREDLEIMRSNGISIPVLCGGAALTKSFVEKSLAKMYDGKVFYCADAFDGLLAMEEICGRQE